MSSPDGAYAGDELELFAEAVNWKAYWLSMITPFLGRRILDVGAGIGSTASLLSRIECDRYLALEPDPELVSSMQAAAKRGEYHPAFEPMQGTIEVLGADDLFDTVLYIDVLEHIEKDRLELARAAKRLARGGRIVILSPAHQWLFTEFDEHIGHFRRYDKASLLAAGPPDLQVERLFYLDSVGLLASLGNKLLLHAARPTKAQIRLWDGWMVPVSRIADRLVGFGAGKSIIAVFHSPA